MIIYHGTDSKSAKNILDNGIDLRRGSKYVDNGIGFYATQNFNFAKMRAEIKTDYALKFNSSKNIHPSIIKLEIDYSDLDLNVLIIDGCNYKWKEFVFLNRLGKKYLKKLSITSDNHNLDANYDIVIDETADADISNIISTLKYGSKTFEYPKIINSITKSDKPDWDKQISFHTEKSLKSIKNIQIIKHI